MFRFPIFVVILGSFSVLTFVGSDPVSTGDRRLIKTSAEEKAQWLNPDEVWELIRDGIKFVDITGNPELDNHKTHANYASEIPTEIRFNRTVHQLFRSITRNSYVQRIVDFSQGFKNRYFNGSWGEASQQWWKLQQVLPNLDGYRGNFSVFEVDHGFRQKSVVARLEGQDSSISDQVVILGAHFDSISRDGPDSLAPGADDNAAGSVVILEAMKLFARYYVPRRTVEFQWYAGEEAGLLGSQAIAQDYKEKGVNVVAMLNQDVIGYYVPGIDDIGLHTDNANPQMIEFVKLLTDHYLDFGRQNMSCGYGCSDHASWTMNGFPAVMTTAVVSNPAHHRSNDTVDAVDERQTAEFIKLAVAFVVEMAEPTEPY